MVPGFYLQYAVFVFKMSHFLCKQDLQKYKEAQGECYEHSVEMASPNVFFNPSKVEKNKKMYDLYCKIIFFMYIFLFCLELI